VFEQSLVAKLNNLFTQLMSIWELYVKLNKRRQSDPGLSWYDHCEAPSTLAEFAF